MSNWVKKQQKMKQKSEQVGRLVNEVQREKAHSQELLDYAMKGYTAILAKVLHEQLGFGPQRTYKILKGIEVKFNEVNAGTLDLDALIIEVNEQLQLDKG